MIVPKRWFIFAICVTIGSTLGAWVLASLVEQQGLPFVLEYFPGINETQMWIKTDEYFNQYGLLVVFAVAASPLVQQPIVILAALTSTPVFNIAAVIFAGRLVKFLVMAYPGSHSPKYLKKIWGIKDDIKVITIHRGIILSPWQMITNFIISHLLLCIVKTLVGTN